LSRMTILFVATMLSVETDSPFGRYIFGIDEVGLGPLAGPLVVVCCAIDLDAAPLIPLTDSKKLSFAQRERIFSEILPYKNKGIYWGCASISAPDLDHMGIPTALKHGIQIAFARCLAPFKPDHILIDGNRRYDFPYPSTSVIKGDSTHYTIAMASVIAKVLRDRWMGILDQLYPQFGFQQHKGYGTKQHLTAIAQNAPTPHHRYSYAPLRNRAE
jgi:ribonuclease HII